MSWPVMVFDIESIPDIAGLRALGLAQGDDDAQAYAGWAAQRAADGKSDFAPLHLQRVLVISCVFRNAEGLRIHSFVDRETEGHSQEGKIIQTFFNTVEKHVPQLVSWNGSGFDLPVLHYRGLKHGVVASKYWDMGEGGDHDSREFKWNNYISRYHMR
ncbi:MAG: ribonuclease H-like domain-containing protein, partial [Betaproteobacteria bacterium]